MQYDLWHYQVQLRRIAAHREKGVEAEIRKAYQDVLIELQAILGKYYAGYGDPETSILTRGDLQAAGQYKNFLEDVLSHLDGLGEPMEQKIRKTVEDTYTTCYTGMAAAVQQVTAGNATLKSLFGGALAVTPETVRHIVEYPIPKLTLSTVFQRRRKQIVSDIQKTLAVGLASGDSYTKMAGRIAKTLGGNEKKARTIVRTEANRAISRGFQDVAEETADLLDGTGYVDVKTWRSMLDGDVRDTHRHLNGKTVYALEQFESKSGAKADCPGHFGVAEEDINCRCILVYSIMSEEEFVAQGGTLPKKGSKKEGQLQLITESDGTFRIKKTDSDLTPAHQGGIIKENNKSVRLWYHEHIHNIPNEIPDNLSMEERARKAFELRNYYRTEARNRMADEDARAELDAIRPNPSFDELIESKMRRKKITREEAIQDIYETAVKSNPEYDKRAGL